MFLVVFIDFSLLVLYEESDIVYCSEANLVLQNTVERIHSGNKYGDIQRGIFLIRGENIVLLGEVVSCISLYLFL